MTYQDNGELEEHMMSKFGWQAGTRFEPGEFVHYPSCPEGDDCECGESLEGLEDSEALSFAEDRAMGWL